MSDPIVRTVSAGRLSGWFVIRRITHPSPFAAIGIPPTHWWRVIYRTPVGDIVLGQRARWVDACELAKAAEVEALVRVQVPRVDQLAEIKAAMAAAGMPLDDTSREAGL